MTLVIVGMADSLVDREVLCRKDLDPITQEPKPFVHVSFDDGHLVASSFFLHRQAEFYEEVAEDALAVWQMDLISPVHWKMPRVNLGQDA